MLKGGTLHAGFWLRLGACRRQGLQVPVPGVLPFTPPTNVFFAPPHCHLGPSLSTLLPLPSTTHMLELSLSALYLHHLRHSFCLHYVQGTARKMIRPKPSPGPYPWELAIQHWQEPLSGFSGKMWPATLGTGALQEDGSSRSWDLCSSDSGCPAPPPPQGCPSASLEAGVLGICADSQSPLQLCV